MRALTTCCGGRTIDIQLNDKETKLIELLRKLPYGKVTVHIENKVIMRVEVNESIKL